MLQAVIDPHLDDVLESFSQGEDVCGCQRTSVFMTASGQLLAVSGQFLAAVAMRVFVEGPDGPSAAAIASGQAGARISGAYPHQRFRLVEGPCTRADALVRWPASWTTTCLAAARPGACAYG